MDCKNILIVEDDEAIRQMMQDVLEIAGYKVSVAADGREGIENLTRMEKGPCLILLDMMMPGMNGWQFLDYQRAHPKASKIPVVVCSAFKESAKSVKPAAFVEKPVRLDTLLDTVKAFCA